MVGETLPPVCRLDQDIHFSADPPGRMAIKQNGIPAVNPNTGASVLAIDPTTGQTIAPVAADEVVPHAPRQSGYRTHRTCDFAGNCYDGWPFTQNDGFMGQSTSNKSLSAPADVKVTPHATRGHMAPRCFLHSLLAQYSG
jgi:hypothetical protein